MNLVSVHLQTSVSIATPFVLFVSQILLLFLFFQLLILFFLLLLFSFCIILKHKKEGLNEVAKALHNFILGHYGTWECI